ncbi:MAG: hypothetical protein IT285_02725 [Bdellovibrionales bacterium]|nr:hypothetical protein [Bdellovibrionales bacterium]
MSGNPDEILIEDPEFFLGLGMYEELELLEDESWEEEEEEQEGNEP